MIPLYSVRAWRLFIETEPCLLPRPTQIEKFFPLANNTFLHAWDGPVAISTNGVNVHGAGFWGLYPKDPEEVSRWMCSRYLEAMDVIGVIEHRGTALMYEKGWRSDRAVVRHAIVVHPSCDNDSTIAFLSKKYACEVTHRKQIAKINTIYNAFHECCAWVTRQLDLDALTTPPNPIPENSS